MNYNYESHVEKLVTHFIHGMPGHATSGFCLLAHWHPRVGCMG